MADKNFKVKNNIVVNGVEIDPSSPALDEILRYDGTKFVSAISGVPSGGLEGQILSKLTDGSYDTQWIDNYADQLRVICKNGTASQINKGTVVMSSGSAGDRIEVEPANANGSVEVKYMLGVAAENIPVDGEGYVTMVGPVSGLNTNSYSVGTILYINPATPGGFTSVEPSAPNIDLPLAVVIKQNVSSGIIFVRMWSQGSKIGELQDVNTTGVTDGQVLAYDSSTQTWLPESVSSGPTGPTGPTGSTGPTGPDTFISQPTAPSDTGVLWLDTDATSNNPSISSTIVDAKGDLIVATASDSVTRLAVGSSNNQVLTVDSSTATGVKWSDPIINGSSARAFAPSGTYISADGLEFVQNGSVSAISPDSNPLDITGDLDLRVYCKLANWTPSGGQILFRKENAYDITISSSGAISMSALSGGITYVGTSTATLGLSSNSSTWVRATLDVDNGSSGRTFRFYTSNDGNSWTQLGSDVVQSGVISITVGTGTLSVPRSFATSGTIYRTQIYNGIDGTLAFDANFANATEDSIAFTESSVNAATVSVATNRYSYGLPGAQFISTSTLSISANTVYYGPFIVTSPISVNAFQFRASTAPVANGNVRLGIYSCNSNMQPINGPVIDSGNVAILTGSAATYLAQINKTTLNPGIYLTAINSSVAFTATTVRSGTNNVDLGNGTFPLQVRFLATQTQGAFPNPGTEWTTKTNSTTPHDHISVLRWTEV